MKVAIIGAGQVGSNAGLNGLLKNIVERVSYFDINADHLQKLSDAATRLAEASREKGVASFSRDLCAAIQATSDFDIFCPNLADADLVVLATPLDTFEDITARMAPYMKKGAVLTDVGSLKQTAIKDIRDGLKKAGREDIHFYGAHPNKANEKQGPDAAEFDMYKDAVVFLELLPAGASNEAAHAYALIVSFWESQGAKVLPIDAETHDMFVGVMSHTEHFGIGFPLAIMGLKSNGQLRPEYKFASTMLCSTTRIARRANTAMWLPIAEKNQKTILKAMTSLQDQMNEIMARAANKEYAGLGRVFQQAQDFRLSLASMDERNNTPRESIAADISDFLGQSIMRGVKSLSHSISSMHKNESFSRAVILPYVIGLAATLNAQHLLSTKVDLPNMANTSFLDGSAPALNDPHYMAELLIYMRNATSDTVHEYQVIAKGFASAIEQGDKDLLAYLIKQADIAASQMPAPRRTASTVRPHYVIS